MNLYSRLVSNHAADDSDEFPACTPEYPHDYLGIHRPIDHTKSQECKHYTLASPGFD